MSGGKTMKHESFAAIGAYHVSGDAKLFMSPHRHQHYVTIKITKASVNRDLSEDWHFGGMEVITEVAMSEAQWAHFVSAPNQGSGTPCTLRYYRDGDLNRAEPPPEHAGNRQTFSDELREHATKVLTGVRSALGALDRMLAGGAVSKADLRKVRGDLSMSLSNDIDGGLGFTLRQAEEWLDKMVESAKAEVEAHALAGLRNIALAAIADQMTPEARARAVRQIEMAVAEGNANSESSPSKE